MDIFTECRGRLELRELTSGRLDVNNKMKERVDLQTSRGLIEWDLVYTADEAAQNLHQNYESRQRVVICTFKLVALNSLTASSTGVYTLDLNLDCGSYFASEELQLNREYRCSLLCEEGIDDYEENSLNYYIKIRITVAGGDFDTLAAKRLRDNSIRWLYNNGELSDVKVRVTLIFIHLFDTVLKRYKMPAFTV